MVDEVIPDEVRVMRNALLEVGLGEYVGFIIYGADPILPHIPAFHHLGLMLLPEGGQEKVQTALLLAHQVHDPTAELTSQGPTPDAVGDDCWTNGKHVLCRTCWNAYCDAFNEDDLKL